VIWTDSDQVNDELLDEMARVPAWLAEIAGAAPSTAAASALADARPAALAVFKDEQA